MANYTDPAYFDRLYTHDPDPWKFASSDYERDKYAATIAALPDRRFTRCYEVGCSIGVLTRQLATRCDEILGVDIAEPALVQARVRCADQPWITFEQAAVPGDWPPGTFDLILFSEVLYYLGIDGLQDAARRAAACLSPGGLVMLVDWRGDTDGACTGEEAADLFIAAAPGLRAASPIRAEKYRIDLLHG